jgi:glycosyltransferase involved in cell wall biosynthesis
MLCITIRSCLEELKSIGGGEIVICDNSDKQYLETLKSMIPPKYLKDGIIKLIRQDFPCLFTARETAIKNSSSDLVLCVDSHMLIGHNMIYDLVNFMNSHTDDKIAFAHAPINWAHQHESRSKHDRDMSINELGDWGSAYTKPCLITWKGMPWICKKEFFLDKLKGYGALSQHRLSWGGGDMHIGIKPWLLGYRNYAVPTSPGIHIGPFPKIDFSDNDKNSVKVSTHDRYRLWSKSGEGPHTLGFLVSCYILGGESMMKRNEKAITDRFGRYLNVKDYWSKAIDLGKDEKAWLDSVKITDFETLLKQKPWEVSDV